MDRDAGNGGNQKWKAGVLGGFRSYLSVINGALLLLAAVLLIVTLTSANKYLEAVSGLLLSIVSGVLGAQLLESSIEKRTRARIGERGRDAVRNLAMIRDFVGELHDYTATHLRVGVTDAKHRLEMTARVDHVLSETDQLTRMIQMVIDQWAEVLPEVADVAALGRALVLLSDHERELERAREEGRKEVEPELEFTRKQKAETEEKLTHALTRALLFPSANAIPDGLLQSRDWQRAFAQAVGIRSPIGLVPTGFRGSRTPTRSGEQSQDANGNAGAESQENGRAPDDNSGDSEPEVSN